MRKLVLAATLVVFSGLTSCQGQKRSTYTNSAGSLALSTDDSLLYAADADNDVIAVIDTGTEAKIAEVKVGRAPERVIVAPTMRSG
jgi:YVTN family beta-propeller protein